MNLAELLLELKTLVKNPGATDRVLELLEQHQGLAEFEVARFFVSRNMIGSVDEAMRDLDPRKRLIAVRRIPLAFASGPAARLLRRVVKDSDPSVAASARAAVRTLGLADVSPPDNRYAGAKGGAGRGGWNPTGWVFGLFANDHRMKKRPKKLQGNDLPKISTPTALAELVGLEFGDLAELMRPGTAPGAPYVEFEVKKRKGGVRRISAPKRSLKAAQRALLAKVLSKLPAHPAAHGFEKEHSTLTNATPHVGAAIVVKMDIQDFFPSIHYRRVSGLFSAYGYLPEVADAIAGLTTHRPKLPDGTVVWPGALPQGAPTSPAIANLVCRRLDARLSALAKKFDAVYTRYADDLTFSFKQPPAKLGRFLWWANALLQQEGFNENETKRRVMRKSGRQAVTGLVVNEKVSIPRADRRRFKAILHNAEKKGVASQARGRERFQAWMEGFASYTQMVHPKLGAQWLKRARALRGP